MPDQRTRAFRVKHLNKVTGDIYQVHLVVADGKPLSFEAGQYLQVLMPEGDPCAYSIASAPGENRNELELHVQCYPGHERAQQVIDHLSSGEMIRATLPHGNCHLGDCPDAPIVLVAAGTGFAQMKSMVEFTHQNGHQHPVSLYWGVRRPHGFYLPHLPVQWSSEWGLHYHPVVSEAEAEDDWAGRHGQLYRAVLDDLDQLGDGAHFYLSGSPDMVYTTLDGLVAAGVDESRVHSDVFDYAPRESVTK
ncbi:MAG: hypothetical protein B0D91_02025 [Oceanospirillales bacterium LUC14_002_19_P2]|nr:MAG: hypothetical protein B0D91_02025 [Oceanospirillales bacterium LUC14_002_19_P2]